MLAISDYKKLKCKFFHKIFLIYSVVIVIAISLISYVLTLNIRNSIEKAALAYNQELLCKLDSYFRCQKDLASQTVEKIYLNQNFHNEILYLLARGYPDLLAYKLDHYCASSAFNWNGIEGYFKACISENPAIIAFRIWSDQRNEVYVFSRQSQIIYPKDSQSTEGIVIGGSPTSVPQVLPAHLLNLGKGQASQMVYSFVSPIHDIFSARTLGKIAIDYSTEGMLSDFRKCAPGFKGDFFIMTQQKQLIVASTGMDNRKNQPPRKHFLKITPKLKRDSVLLTINPGSLAGTFLTGVILQRSVYAPAQNTFRLIGSLALLAISGTILVAFLVMKKLSKRIDGLIEPMKQVCQGDLSIRIPTRGVTDEITEIAVSFNQMCSELDKYIQQVYIAEIKQHQAQLKAFQAQINPHFLYNTLEAIRMRAVAQGIGDVGEMIYLLGALLRYSVKEQTIVSIRDEVRHSQLYFDLYNLRYQGRLGICFNAPEDLMDYCIIKNVLQPIIENYLIHGVDFSKNRNLLTLDITRDGDSITIVISDNGLGIPPERLENLLCSMSGPTEKEGTGLGLANVNQRIRLFFGSPYGLSIQSVAGEGTVVKLTIPVKKREEFNTNVQGIVDG